MGVTPDLVLSVCLGIGLSAACGFRVFIPLLAASAAALGGYLQPSSGFEWLATWPAFGAFAVAAVLEIAAYSIPWVDHAMDSIAAPAAAIAGALVMASSLTDMSPWLKWTLAIIAGGGSAALVQGSTMAVRGLSTVLTGGLGNLGIAAFEGVLAVGLSLLSLALPLAGACAVLVILVFLLRAWRAAGARRSSRNGMS